MVVSDTFEWNGKHLVPGSEFAVTGHRGARFRFLNFVTHEDTAWVNCVGGPAGHVMLRSFRPTQISRVTRLIPVEHR